ncbi:MAG: hypothetical protein J7K39_12340 [Bacteroidales bacterium]|nr:hypothetical protein [Bacteroidales bacterium]
MKKTLFLSLIFVFALSTTTKAQFGGFQKKLKNKFEQRGKAIGKKKADEAKEKAKAEGQKKGEEQMEKAEAIGMDQAEKNLDKARVAAEPGLQKAEEYNKKAEDYTRLGLGKAQEWSDDYVEGAASQNPEDYKRYAFRTAIVEYKVEGPQKGTKTMYIDMSGYKIAEYRQLKKEKQTQILIGADIISIDYKNKSAIKMHNPLAYALSNSNRDWEETAENILVKMGFEKKGQEKIAGKTCDIWKHGTHRIWVWNGLTLKSVAGNTKETATSIKVDTKVSSDMFEVPKGFALETHDASELFPDFDEANAALDANSDEDLDELLDEIENMTYLEYKAKVLEEDPNTDPEKIKQAYLLLRQQAKRRHK